MSAKMLVIPGLGGSTADVISAAPSTVIGSPDAYSHRQVDTARLRRDPLSRLAELREEASRRQRTLANEPDLPEDLEDRFAESDAWTRLQLQSTSWDDEG